MLLKLSLHIQFLVSNSQTLYAMKLKHLSENSFEGNEEEIEKFIGWNGRECASPSHREDWVLKIWLCIMMFSWQSRHDASFMIPNLYFTESSKLSSSPIVRWWRQQIPKILFTLGKASSKEREVIKRWASCKIGIGVVVDIWGSNWLPTRNNPTIISPVMRGLPSHKVSFLIDPMQRVSKEHILDNYFFEFEEETTKRIPLYQSIQEDVLFWPWNPDGEYSVKSGY